MGWIRTTTTGSGAVAFRLSIEGYPYQAVSDARMEQVLGDGRERVRGLKSDRITLSERVDLLTTEWEPSGFRATIVDYRRKWTSRFHLTPSNVTVLAQLHNASATTITVKSTVGFASSGVIHVNREAISYTATTATTFTTAGRGAWDTLAAYHYTETGDGVRFPEVTDHPPILVGRRVQLYVYGAGDDPQGDGTQIWAGIVSSEPRYDGKVWEFGVDPPSRLLDQDLGNELEDPVDISGIYYPATYPLIVSVVEFNGRSVSAASSSVDRTFAIAGFWRTQDAFCDALTIEIAAQLALETGFTQAMVAKPLDDGWCLEFITDSTTPVLMTAWASSATDAIGTRTVRVYHVAGDRTRNGVTAAGDEAYQYRLTAGGLEPRTTLGSVVDPSVRSEIAGLSDAQKSGIDVATNPAGRMYLSGVASLTSDITTAVVEWNSNGVDEGGKEGGFTADVLAVDTSARHVTLGTPSTFGTTTAGGTTTRERAFYAAVGSEVVEARLGRGLGEGTLADFIDAITADTAQYLNTGGVPDLRAADFVSPLGTTSDIADAASISPFLSRRGFTFFSPQNVKDVIKEECKLLGVIPALDSTGKITFHKIRLPSPSEVSTATLTAADIVTGQGEWLGLEPMPYGMAGRVDLSYGYDPIEDEHTKRRVFRDVDALGRNALARTLEIKPLSVDLEAVTVEDEYAIGGRILGVFGGQYALLTVKVKLTRIGVLVGDVVDLNWAKLPNALGTLGVTSQIALVVGRDWTIRSASGRLTLLVSQQRVGGYVPATKISGAITGTTGTTGPFASTVPSTYFPGSTKAADWWAAGDKVRLYEYDTTNTSNNVTATVDSVVANSVTWTTDTNWTHDAGPTWCLGSQVSTAITADSQMKFAYIARSDVRLDWSGDPDNPPFTMAP